MMLILLRAVIVMLLTLTIVYNVPGFEVHNHYELFFFTLLVALLNAFVRPIVVLLTLPITILTLGLFTFVINMVLFYLAVFFSYGVHIHRFIDLVWGAIVIWISGLLTNRFIWKKDLL